MRELVAPHSKLRRDTLSEQGKCINGPSHGPLMPGKKRCAWCVLVHRVGVRIALELVAADPTIAQRPDGHVPKLRGEP